MFPALPSSLDQLASEGIVNFDSEAFIKGTTPRYVGAPHMGLPFEQPLNTYNPAPQHGAEQPQLAKQPHKDEFINKKEEHKIPAWKKLLAGGLLAGVIAFVGIKYGKNIAGFFSKIKMPKTKAPSPAPAATATAAATTATAGAATTAKPSKAPMAKWKKWTIGGVLAGLGILGAAKLYSKHKEVKPAHSK